MDKICQRCGGSGFKREWVVERQLGDSYVRVPVNYRCHRCKGDGVVKG